MHVVIAERRGRPARRSARRSPRPARRAPRPGASRRNRSTRTRRHARARPASSRRSVRPIRLTTRGRPAAAPILSHGPASRSPPAPTSTHVGAALARQRARSARPRARRPALGVAVRGARREADERRRRRSTPWLRQQRRRPARERVAGRRTDDARATGSTVGADSPSPRDQLAGSTSDWWTPVARPARPRASAASARACGAVAPALGMPARRATHAGRNEFGSRTMASKPPLPAAAAASCALVERRRTLSGAAAVISSNSGATAGDRRDRSACGPANAARTAAIAGSAITRIAEPVGRADRRARAIQCVRLAA